MGNQLQGLLVRMVEDSAEQRASLEEAMSLCQTYCPEDAEEEVDKLVTYILGNNTMDVSNLLASLAGQLDRVNTCHF